MEKRLLLAVVLMTAAIMITNVLFPPPEPPVVDLSPDTVVAEAPAAAPEVPMALPMTVSATGADTVVVESELYRYAFSTRGAALVGAELLAYRSYVVEGEPVQLVPEGEPRFLEYGLAVGADTVRLSRLPFQSSARHVQVTEEATAVDFTYADETGFGVAIRYRFDPAGYLIDVSGRVEGLTGRAQLLAALGPRLAVHEDPDHRSEREFAVVTRIPGAFERIPFRNIDGTQGLGTGLTWAGMKDKYFLAVILAGEQNPLVTASARDVPDDVLATEGGQVDLPQVELTTVVPIREDGTFGFQSYFGPQEYSRLSVIGYDLEEVTPYGYRWLQPIIRPFAALILWILNGLHDTLGIAYGWVLVIFGVMMRIVLWPLNAKAMRAQMKNMAVQPLMQEIREKHRDNPQKQQEAMLGLYKEHGFNPLGGCLPMLVPFPVLITLFFVFQNTIAFRGAEFLWLPDLSLRDPFYILPFVLVVSMFALQWVSAHLSGMEQNPQMKMMLYFMPIMMGAIFFMLPAGLNLYYAVTQVASIPQQVLIAKERKRAQEELKKAVPPKLSTPAARSRGKARGKR
ncbi:MAG TPA: membrane protein insertase YidC [Longimicrobiaceae bacterium]|nr:membrane protein insertase YidC [Longimicrobiaceae bacterium]